MKRPTPGVHHDIPCLLLVAQLSLTLLLDTLLPPLPRRLGLRTLGVHLLLELGLAGGLSLGLVNLQRLLGLVGLVDLWCMLVAEL